MGEFDLGRIAATMAVQKKMDTDHMFLYFVKNATSRFMKCDWGCIARVDEQANKMSLKKGGRLLGRYKYLMDGSEATIWIVTEANREITTIMFEEEY